ncbi:hypothetical protein BDR04DRAFT_1174363 [Suillus decipiens]|nr:hypothetical protein BDR04DRAFT_1174363 [Suillus decipiens]
MKAELRSSKKSKKPSETKRSRDDGVIQLLDGTIAVIDTAKGVVSILLARGILETIANILTVVKTVIKNKSDFQAIANKCKTIGERLKSATKDATADDLPEYLGRALFRLKELVNNINSDIASKKEKGFFSRLDFTAEWCFKVENMPPSRPAMLHGYDGLVAELTNLVINKKHLVLIGPGGMGKSSVAKAIINEQSIKDKFADRHFFVTYDGLDPSAITFETFMMRFVEALGIDIAGVDPLCQISSFLRSANTLVVLDNAETFEEASQLSASKDILAAIAEIANIDGILLVLTSRSRRNASNMRCTTKNIPPLDLNSARAVKVLEGGKGKLHKFSDTMQLLLSSPSVQDLDKDGLHVLAIIANLPQGLNEDMASHLLPSLLQVDHICDVLCMQSLVYCQDKFLKMLAPIWHYVQDSLQAPDMCLQEIHTFYYHTVASCLKECDWYANIIISDHPNIEDVVAFNLANIQDDTEETYVACWQFLERLTWHLPCLTTLTPAISNIIANSSM